MNSVNSENKERKSMYKKIVKVAKQEKIFDIAKKIEQITRIKIEHENDFKIIKSFKTNNLFF